MADWSLQRLSGSLKTVGASLAAGLAGLAPDTDKEKVEFAQFGTVEYQACSECPQSAVVARRVLLLAYSTGFQVGAHSPRLTLPLHMSSLCVLLPAWPDERRVCMGAE